MSLTIWGTSDDKSWLTSSTKVDAPLLFDPSLQEEARLLGVRRSAAAPGRRPVDARWPPRRRRSPAGQGGGLHHHRHEQRRHRTSRRSPRRTTTCRPRTSSLTTAVPAHTGVPVADGAGGLDLRHAGRRRQRAGAVHDRRRWRSARTGHVHADGHAGRLRGRPTRSASSRRRTSRRRPPIRTRRRTTRRRRPIQVSNPPPVITANGALDTTVECAHLVHRRRAPPRPTRARGRCRCRRRAPSTSNAVGNYAVTYSASDQRGRPGDAGDAHGAGGRHDATAARRQRGQQHVAARPLVPDVQRRQPGHRRDRHLRRHRRHRRAS